MVPHETHADKNNRRCAQSRIPNKSESIGPPPRVSLQILAKNSIARMKRVDQEYRAHKQQDAEVDPP